MRPTSLTLIVLAINLAVGACATSPVHGLRFKNTPLVLEVNDRQPLTRAPQSRGFARAAYFFDRFFARRVERLAEVKRHRHAQNVNALDDVPDSSWFVNHRTPLTRADVRRGPNRSPGPSRNGKWIVTGTKVGGKSPGLLIKDQTGAKFILKFDEAGFPEIETAANVIAQRLLWTCGFNVPEDDIVHFERNDLELASDATISDTFGNKRTMKLADLDALFGRIDARGDGSYRGMTSRFLSGVPLGGTPPEGTRQDDPNDIVDHQHRRELRGQYVVFSWLDHTDVKEDNTLDMLVRSDDESGDSYVKHYLVDFGKALGTAGAVEQRADDGFAFLVDFQYTVASAFGLGFWRRPWEGRASPTIVGVGRFEAERFQPWSWRPSYPWEPFLEHDRFDGLWGAKLVARIGPDLIRAAVEAGQYSDPAATDYVTTTLIKRREKILRYWFSQAAPLDQFSISDRICFVDLADKVLPRATAFTIRAYDYEGQALSDASTQPANPSGCYATPARGTTRDRYTIFQIVTRRGTSKGDLPIEVHVADDPLGKPRIVGLVRR